MDGQEHDDEPRIDAQPLEQTAWTGHSVRDRRNRRAGTVVDVYYDDESALDAPRWLVVDPGPFRRSVVVPARGARCVEDHVIVVPWTREEMKAAPRVATSGSLTDREERMLLRHFGVDSRTRDLS
jgi:hypothetical protein